ncbi:protein spotted leaf 11 [Sesamum alatum]|uniref:U-box domain-containing protein n=1 Tax=Sesamum alatum TaxID=300844 RepID=A0AAE1YMM9_9LAMI|nr:protein spotted leaf 11 [Sesamum alatum]
MSSPIILSSGHTFNWACIQQWLDVGHRTCLISKLPLLEPPSLIPNHTLHNHISNYTLVSFLKPQHNPPNPQTLIHALLPSSSPLDEKLSSLDQLNRICKRDSAICQRLSELGTVSVVLKCTDSSEFGFAAYIEFA